ncbi:DoxX family protein [Tenacibaculum xiamenense]|uniref:DoxX family protein n=1 Tax=Tenacibaculum xiamenense TaxID=1261553 RepID=UPI0038B631EA
MLSIIIQKLLNQDINFAFAGRLALSVMLIFTTIGHFIFTEGMSKMIPHFIPLKKSIVILTGFLELLISVGIFIPNIRLLSGWGLIVFLIIIVPTNIKASIENLNYQTGSYDGNGLSYLWFRIPLQLFFICWTYFFVILKK